MENASDTRQKGRIYIYAVPEIHAAIVVIVSDIEGDT